MTTSHQPQPLQFGLRKLFELTAVVAAVVAGVRFGGLFGAVFAILALAAVVCIWAASTRRWSALSSAGGIVVVCLLILLLLPWDLNAVRSRNRVSTHNNLKQIGLALWDYEEKHGRFPPAVVYDAQGQPLHSWRALILRGVEEAPLHQTIKFDEPWDSPHNRRFMNVHLRAYRSPEDTKTAPFDTSYVALIAPDSIWSRLHGAMLDEITDGPENTLIVIEMKNSGIHWAEPRDLDLDNLPPGIGKQKLTKAISPHKQGICAVHADAHVEVIPSDATIAELKAAASKSGGDRVDFMRDRQRVMPSSSLPP